MSKDYVRKRPAPQRKNPLRQFLIIVASFLCGYLAATVFDFTSLMAWVNKNVLSPKSQDPAPKAYVQKSALPKPKFEFYTLLSKDNNGAHVTQQPAPTKPSLEKLTKPQVVANAATHISAPTKSDVAGIKPARAPHTDSFLIQIASFNKMQDAEQLKAMLALRGFDVAIASVIKQNVTWFRVSIGPFNSFHEAEKAQDNIARTDHMKGIILKMVS